MLRDNTGPEPRRAELFAGAYADARKEAAGGTRLELRTTPETAPFTLADFMDEVFWAGPLAP